MERLFPKFLFPGKIIIKIDFKKKLAICTCNIIILGNLQRQTGRYPPGIHNYETTYQHEMFGKHENNPASRSVSPNCNNASSRSSTPNSAE